VVLQIDSLDTFISELRRRGINDVRATTWYKPGGLGQLLMKRRFTAYDPHNGLILRLDVVYYRGFYYASDQDKQQVKEAYEKRVKPVEEQISQVAEILDGEYHNGSAQW
jgi:hypothetical protein